MFYLKLFLALFSRSTKSYVERRGNTFGTIILITLNFFIMIFVLEIMFLHTNSIAGWSKEEIFLVIGFSKLFATTFSLLFQRSINFMVGGIASGGLDLILIKPMNSQFYYSFYLTRPFEIFNLLAPILLIGYALNQLTQSANLLNIFLLLTTFICGILIFYALYIMIATITFWVGRFYAFPSLYQIMTTPLSLPTDIYGLRANFILTFIIPLAFIATIPIKIYLGKVDPTFTALAVLVTAITLTLSIKFWNHSLKNYTSASS